MQVIKKPTKNEFARHMAFVSVFGQLAFIGLYAFGLVFCALYFGLR